MPLVHILVEISAREEVSQEEKCFRSLTSQVKKMIDEPVSVIIPTWNSLPEFEICLKWLKKSVPRNVLDEIIVIDRYSNDGTVEVAKKYGCVLHQSNSILGKARMEGIQLVKNKIILFVDSDILLSPKWFERIQKYWDEKTGMLCGRTIDDSNKLGKMLVYLPNFFSVSAIFSLVFTTVSGFSEMLSIPHSTKNSANSGKSDGA